MAELGLSNRTECHVRIETVTIAISSHVAPAAFTQTCRSRRINNATPDPRPRGQAWFRDWRIKNGHRTQGDCMSRDVNLVDQSIQ